MEDQLSNVSLPERDRRSVWHPYTHIRSAASPIPIVKGEGVWLWDENGKKYLDGISSWWVNIHGHSHPYIAEKVSRQLRELEHVIFAGFTHAPAVTLAERLLRILPGNPGRVFFSDNGSTAVEAAVKMAVQFHANRGSKRTRILALENSYHGDTFGAMSVSSRGLFTDPFRDMMFDVVHLPFPEMNHEADTLRALKRELELHGPETAAFIFEPLVLGAGGMRMYAPSLAVEWIRACRETGVLVIADEVMTGFGRTGKNFACEHFGEAPDIFCLSKGLTGGTMAMGVTACSEEIFASFESDDRSRMFFHGHSFTANPLACAASLASLDLFLSEGCQASITRISQMQAAFAAELRHSGVNGARSTGTIVAFELGEGASYTHSLRDRIWDFFMDRGIILRPLGNTVYFMPPYCISETEMRQVHEAMKECIRCFRS